jgi:arabinose-5-phosphate isomerase
VEDYVRFHPGGSLGPADDGGAVACSGGGKLPIAGVRTIRQMLDQTSDVKRHGAVMIVDEAGRLAGIITDADLRRLLARRGAAALDLPAGAVMTPGCKRIRADALAAEATALFHKYRIDELPVVDADERPVGLIDVQDIVTIKVVG